MRRIAFLALLASACTLDAVATSTARPSAFEKRLAPNSLEALVGRVESLLEFLPPLRQEEPNGPRPRNATVTAACRQVDQSRSQGSILAYYGSSYYRDSIKHYFGSSAQLPVCIFRPKLATDLQLAMSVIHARQVEFAVAAGKHTGQPGFSSTRGLHIDLSGFDRKRLSGDGSFIDVGAGQTWDEVYNFLEGTGRAVMGGRVTGIGVGGFITGGGGYSYLSSQYGLTTESVLSMNVVLPNGTAVYADKHINSDMFFAVKGGGNQFGIVYQFRLKTYPQTEKIWGGTQIYLDGSIDEAVQAIYDFQRNNKDRKAQLVPSFNTVVGFPFLGLLASYDGLAPPKDTFAAFDSIPHLGSWGPSTPYDLAAGSLSNLSYGIRGRFHAVSGHYFTPEIIAFAKTEGERLGGLLNSLSGDQPAGSGSLFSIVPDSIINGYGAYTTAQSNAWSYEKSPQPLSMYFGWGSSDDDELYTNELKKTAAKIKEMLVASGQDIHDLPLYPNYALGDTPAEQIYEPANLARLRRIKRQVDPQGTMRLAGYFKI